MAQKYAITGGPSAGKSSVILALERKGEHIVREAAEDVIKYHQANGNSAPWTNPDFQDWVLELQLQREQKIPASAERVFLDRGVADGLAYYLKDNRQPSKALEQALGKMDYQKKVFLIENLGDCQKTETRRENKTEAQLLEGLLEKVYSERGYEVIRVKPGTVEERANYILANL